MDPKGPSAYTIVFRVKGAGSKNFLLLHISPLPSLSTFQTSVRELLDLGEHQVEEYEGAHLLYTWHLQDVPGAAVILGP